MSTTEAPQLAEVTEEAVTVDDVRSPYLHAGPADDEEAVVLVHGNPGPKEDRQRLMTRTGAITRSVAPDMPGFGPTPAQPRRR